MTVVALLRQRLRRDWLQLTLWILGTAALAATAVSGVESSYGSLQDRQEVLAAVMANPVIMLFRGLPSGAEREAFTLFLIFPFLAMMAAFMSSFLAVRHTRAEEEIGRAELVSATPAGRTAPTSATIVHGLLANLILAALVALVYVASGFAVAGSLIAGAAAGAVGVVFLGVGLVAAQLMRTSRGANSLSVWVLIATFVLCGLGNALGTPSADLQRIESSWLTWLSPFGWAENARPFADDAWWPVILCLGVGIVLIVAAAALQPLRDVGESFIAQRPGRLVGPASLSSPLGLVWRLSRGALVGWCVGGLLTGLLSTSLASVVNDLGTDIPALQDVLTALSENGTLEEGMVVIFFLIVGVLAACAAVQTVARARQEETHGTAELLLSAPVGRVRWLAGYLVMAVAGVIAVCASAVFGAWAGTLREGETDLVGDALVAGLGQAVAASVFIAVTALVFVVAPRLTIPVAWALVLVALLLGLFAPLFDLPDAVADLSPFTAAPTIDDGAFDAKGLWWLLAATGVVGAAALVLMRRRPLATTG
ncbi:ABC transporter permease [Microbacterium timonense]|uniref:ABC transporter permease n=1 Tax=Microbacterium timonense TaxID=2086576 RepID=UPI000D0F377C|nr:polyketide antibiotic transporter [Microbacterium timonense]